MSSSHNRAVVTVTSVIVLSIAAVALVGCGLVPIGQRSASDSGSATVSPDMAVSPPLDTGAAKNGASTDELAVTPAAPTDGTGADASTIPAEDRLVVRTVDLRLKVDEVETVAQKVRKAAEQRKGMVVDYQVSSDEGVPVYRTYTEGSALSDGAALSGYLTVRLPADQLESFTNEVAGLGTILRQAENESDVTQQHVDLKARLVNLQATEAQLRKFFDKAKNVTEMLAIEQELSRVRGEIEAMQAQISYLERQAAMSTVTVELVGPTPIVEPSGESWGFAEALRQALRGFVGTINALIIVVGTLAPLLILGLVAFLAIRAIVRRRRARSESRDSSPVDQDATDEPSDIE